MAESMRGLKRTCRCAELSAANVGQTVTVMGWVQKSRHKGGIVFVDLRDRSGIIQLIFEESNTGAEGFEKAAKLRDQLGELRQQWSDMHSAGESKLKKPASTKGRKRTSSKSN